MGTPRLDRIGIVDVTFGENVQVVEPVNLYGCFINDNCFIGPFVEIQKDAVIGRNSRVQSHSLICEMVEIGENCFISHGVMFINDPFRDGRRAGGNKALWKATRVGNGVCIGTNATILPVSICDGCVIGAGAVVTKDLDQPGVYAGNPARCIRKFSSGSG